MNINTDILIIGSGVIGASIFYHLVRDGHEVTLLEKNTLASGCTKASGGIVRCFHLEASWCDKSVYGSEYYLAFQQHTGKSIVINHCGFIFIPHQDSHDLSRIQVQRLSQHIQIEWLHQHEIEKRFSHVFKNVPSHIVYEPNAFYVSPVQVTKSWVQAGQASGGKLYEFTEVKNIYPKRDSVEAILSSGKVTAKTIVIAAGAHTPHLLDQLGYQHSLFKKNIRLDLRKPANSLISHPAFVDEESGLYGRIDRDSGQLYVGMPTSNRSFAQHSEAIYQHGLNRLIGMEKSILQTSRESDDCYSHDQAACVLALNEEKTIYLASGFSGGGLKIAPWVGYETAKLIKEKKGSYA